LDLKIASPTAASRDSRFAIVASGVSRIILPLPGASTVHSDPAHAGCYISRNSAPQLHQVLDGHLLSPEWKTKKDWKEQHLTTRLAADFTDWESDNANFEAQIDRVVKALRADGGARPTPPKPRLQDHAFGRARLPSSPLSSAARRTK
jgi:hypothetical protein